MNTARVTLLGLGQMGRMMAPRLVKAGYRVRAWTRSDRSGEDIEGCTLERDAGAAVAEADIVLLVLTDAAAIEAVLFRSDVLSRIRRGTVVIDMGTTGPRAAKEHAERLAQQGIRYLDCPVSGGVVGAKNGTLAIFVGGDAQTLQLVRPVLSQLGVPHHVGGAGSGQTLKLANQIIVGVTIAAVCEGIAFAQRQGLDAPQVVKCLQGGFADSTVLRQHGARIAAGDFSAGGACRLHLKDLNLVKEMLPSQSHWLRHTALCNLDFESLVRDGFGDADHSAYFRTYEMEGLHGLDDNGSP